MCRDQKTLSRMRILFSLFLMLFPFWAFGQAVVDSVLSSNQIIVRLNGSEGFFDQKRVVILSKEKNKIIAIGRIRDTEMEVMPGIAKIDIEEIVENFLIVPDDEVEILNYRLYKDKKIPGFFSLTLDGSIRTPSQFKELAYFGVFTSEGHNLDQKEVLISPFQVQYGVSNEFGVRVVNSLWLDGYANIGAKYRVMKNKHAKITINGFGAYKVQDQDWINQFGGVVTIPSNSKFQSHFMVNVTFDPQYEESRATSDLALFQDSDIRSITEYITDDWNRVLYGPVYNVELQTFGGTVSHMWIWDTFHMSLGIATRDFSNLTFGTEGYYYVYDLFWRF